MKTSLFICFILILVSPSLAWWENGHMLVAQIAKLDLLQNNPTIYPYAEQTALLITGYTFGLSTSFIEAAVWADDVKSVGWGFWDSWHFINKPYDPSGMFTPADVEDMSPWAINQTLTVLTSNLSNAANLTLEKSIMLRMMMHIIGDMHQPLHNVEYYSAVYPDGDLGGNLINVTWDGEATELHAFWDSIAETLPTFSRPLNQSSLEFFENFGVGLMQEFPRTAFSDELAIDDPLGWTDSVYLDAVEFAYELLPSDFVLGTAYQQTTYEVCRRNIALGGYRLADKIVEALGNQTVVVVEEWEGLFMPIVA